ncbi:hypothetical protein ARTHRO8AJ_90046 [Arthrobacter sp. 8AJ]|nr:hypothetical protein ARTHRO8AJ_90046 [Arthrobacter sp. 8AJ]
MSRTFTSRLIAETRHAYQPRGKTGGRGHIVRTNIASAACGNPDADFVANNKTARTTRSYMTGRFHQYRLPNLDSTMCLGFTISRWQTP